MSQCFLAKSLILALTLGCTLKTKRYIISVRMWFCLDLGCATSIGPKLVVFLHPSAESGSDSLSPEFRSLALLSVHADHFINDCAYGSIGYAMLMYFYVYMLRLLLRVTW